MAKKQTANSDRLASYRQKRNFKLTPEPDTNTVAASRQLVVQRHFARREHFDLRLEMQGVLISWAVTRGPSLDPAEKRLAVRTEDHPLDYATFEGIIPKGEYGGGTVMLWDEGSYISVTSDPAEALQAGQIKFIADGRRLRGSWVLVHMKKSPGNWLLIKENDAFAQRGTDSDLPSRFTTSIATGRTRKEIEGGSSVGLKRSAAVTTDRPPAFVKPQLCDLATTVPQGREWLFEMKYDGYRLQLARQGDEVRAYSRNGQDWTRRFPLLASAVRRLKCKSLLLDGEAIVFDKRGFSDFSALIRALESEQSTAVQFAAFDLLAFNGTDYRDLPLLKRKARLKRLLRNVEAPLRLSHYVTRTGAALFDKVSRSGGEGIIAKRIDAPYRSGRSSTWCKIKSDRRDDVFIVGYMPSKVSQSFASLLAAVAEGNGYRYAGRVGSGYSARKRSLLVPYLRESVASLQNVFTNADKLPHGVRFIAAWPRAEIRHGGWTADGQLRHARFLGLRDDLPPAEPRALQVRHSGLRPSPPRVPVLTHPERVVYADEGITKRDVAEYYAAVTDKLFPYLRDRPASLLRAPDGIGQGTFFQRHPLPGAQHGLAAMAASDEELYLVVKEKIGIATACQFGTVEFHTWMVRDTSPLHPDKMVFDLDPDENLAFIKVTEAALIVRDYLSAVKLQSWVLATGGKGLHLVVPLEGKLTVDQVANFSANFARGLCKQEPKRFVASMSKRLRKGKIFLDWQRNQRGATTVVPWSLRARPGAPVAVPLAWSELNELKSAAKFDWHSAPSKMDPWDDFSTQRQTIAAGTLSFLGGD